MFLITHPPCYSYIQSGQSFGSDRGSKNKKIKKSTQKVKDPLSFEIWIFRNGQEDYDDDRMNL